MKSLLQMVGAVTLCIFLTSAGVTNASSSIPYYSGLQRWDYILYQILDFNETAPVYWFTDTGQSYAVSANRSSHLLYEFLSVGGKSPSPYDPNEVQAYGNSYVGNLSRTNASMYEMASNLALSIYPWYPGFLASVNWTYETQQAQIGRDTLVGELTVTNITRNALGVSTSAIMFDFKQDSRFQNTTLIYDLNTGVLLYGGTLAGNYKLELESISSDIITGTGSVPFTPTQIITSVGVLFGAIILTATLRRKFLR